MTGMMQVSHGCPVAIPVENPYCSLLLTRDECIKIKLRAGLAVGETVI